MAPLRSWIAVSFLSAILWAIVETMGGLAFLAGGIRLWSYHVVPVFWSITSPVIWIILFVGMPPFIFAFRAWEKRNGRSVVIRCLYLMIVGPVMEVAINEGIFRGLLGRPLFLYEVLPTFGGSGSLLSPLYYLTLYPHYALTERLLTRKSLVPSPWSLVAPTAACGSTRDQGPGTKDPEEVTWKPCS